ncbi:MAG: SprT-like domain-containing protein [Gammaproteobacteria bacterium]|nr:SprT-like domain-containing protein [Gammaproteobacteria bacterium]
MKIRNQLQSHAIQRTVELLELASRSLGFPLPQVAIRFDLRGCSAGMVRSEKTGILSIRYHPVLLAENGDAFIKQTVPHEVAHVVVACRCRGRVRPHGPEWRSIMNLFGAEPRRCHDYDLSTTPKRHMSRHAYHCDCREHRITAILRNRIIAGQRYLCRQCGTELRARAGCP